MSTPTRDFTWVQGADLTLNFVYKEGDDPETATPVDLTDYQLRMDVVSQDVPPVRIVTLNSDDITDGDVDDVGSADNEATLGADGSIAITISRALTLEGGPIYDQMQAFAFTFKYDIFLRDGDGLQHPILKGSITVEPSVTLWA